MFQEIFSHLWENKLRTALTGLSVSVGIFLLIVLLGAGNGLIHAFESNMGQFATDVVSVWPGYMSQAYDGLPEGRGVTLDKRDLASTSAAFPQRVKGAVAKNSLNSTLNLHYKDQRTTLWLSGVYPEELYISRPQILAGRFINDIDLRESRKSLVITEKMAQTIFGSSMAALNKEVRLDSVVYRIVGVKSNQGDFGTPTCYTAFSTLNTIYNKGLNIEEMKILTRGIEQTEAAKAFESDLRRSVARRHRFAPTDEKALWIDNAAEGAKERDMAMSILRQALWFIGLLTLLSGVVSISNIMLITVKERTHEFGIRKALGARPWSILRSVLAESIIITLLSGYVGLVAGIAATEWMSKVSGEQVMEIANQRFYTFLNPTVDLGIALTALVVLIVAGLIAGFFPARKAVKVKPIEALNAR